MTKDNITVGTEDNITAGTESTPAEKPMRILKVATCPSLSGRSELTYHLGCDEAGGIHFRLWANTAAGMFTKQWFSMAEVSKLLSSPEGITSKLLQPLWQYTSQNNAGFSLAVLKGEGLIQKSADHSHAYQTANPAPFLERIRVLVASGVALKDDDAPMDTPVAVSKRGRPKKVSGGPSDT